MSVKVPVSYGELCDKISILQIKMEKGITAAEKEYDALMEIYEEIDEPIYVLGLRSALKAINETCWMIEDSKRQCERDRNFGEWFIDCSRAAYILNDERARLKGLINKYMNSDIYEHKNHGEY